MPLTIETTYGKPEITLCFGRGKNVKLCGEDARHLACVILGHLYSTEYLPPSLLSRESVAATGAKSRQFGKHPDQRVFFLSKRELKSLALQQPQSPAKSIRGQKGNQGCS